MSKKAIELSMNTIIVAAVALIVFVVIVMILTGQLGSFMRGFNDCGAKTGDSSKNSNNCKDSDALCVASGGVPSGKCIFYDSDGSKSTSDNDERQVCCVHNR